MRNSADVKILKIQKADLKDIQRMMYRLNLFHRENLKVNPQFLEKAYKTELFQGLILRINNKAVAFSVGYDWFNFVHNTRHHQIDLFFVEEKFRGQNLGRLLLEGAVKKAQKRGCAVIDVTASPFNKEAQKFYKNYGFKLRKKTSLDFRLNL